MEMQREPDWKSIILRLPWLTLLPVGILLQRFASELAPLFEQKLIAYDASTQRLRLTERGMEVGNQIFEVFVIT